MKKGRSAARELALKCLYQASIKGRSPKDWKSDMMRDHDYHPDVEPDAASLADRVWNHQEELDHTIGRFSIDWTIDRISHVDKAILRIGFYELLFTKTDPAVIINEGIELAKRFSSDDAPSFINGIFGKYVDLECSQELSKE